MLDEPIINLIHGFNSLPYCFTLQSCYGHFIDTGQASPHNLEPLPRERNHIGHVEYRIAYIAFCIEHSLPGRRLFEVLRSVPAPDPENIQFCCAEWFWQRQVNSYALQVMPERFKHQDRAFFDYNEALRIEKRREQFFARLKILLEGCKQDTEGS